MEHYIESIVDWAAVLVPLLSLWAILGLHTQKPGEQCIATQILYFSAMLFISGITIRTVMAEDDGCWLVHTASLGAMIVAGVMRRPEVATVVEFANDSMPA